MKILLVLMFILTSIEAVENEDRVESHRKQKQNSINSRPLKKYILNREPTLIPEFEYTRDTIALIDEDFESGMPAGWTVIDGNNDGHTWTTGTYYLLYYHPPNYGTAYAYYADNVAGSGAPAGTEYLISPAARCAGATTMRLSYSWGHNQMTDYAYGTAQIKLHNGVSWGGWNTLATFVYTTNGVDTFNLDSYLPAESVQVQFTYEDPLGEWGLAFGIDNVLIEAEMPSLFIWDFEMGLQGWTHTNGMAYPAGWDVESSGIHASQAPPSAGDSCMWIDSDAMGFGFWMQDSALSPFCTPNPAMDWMVYGICNYHFGGSTYLNEMHVGIKYEVSGVWTAVELAYYGTTAAFGPAWDSVDVSAYAIHDHIRPYFYFDDLYTWGYWAAFDNVSINATPFIPDHDVGCTQVVSPPEGSAVPCLYNVTGRVRNFGSNFETFDVMAIVWDTVVWTQVFSQGITLTNFPVAADSNVCFGTVTFDSNSFYYTEIYTMLPGDFDPSNDTSAIYSRTGLAVSDIIFEMDAQLVCNDNQLIGLEFDGTHFYITGANNATDPNKVYVIDTTGNLIWALDQPSHSIGWGWRDLCWDNIYSGPDRIDTLYGSVNSQVDYFSIDIANGQLLHHGFFPGAQNPNRALAYRPDSSWFFTANFTSDCYVFKKNGFVGSVPNTLAMYGAAYDSDPTHGGWVWWHSQDDPGTGFHCQITQMDANTMEFTGFNFGYDLPSGLTDGVAGGLCFYEGFRGADVLFAIIQGTPNDYLVGVALRDDTTGIAQNPDIAKPRPFGFSQSLPLFINKSMTIDFTTNVAGPTSLKIYDIMGRHVRNLLGDFTEAGEKSITWDGKNDHQQNVSNGIYILRLQAGDRNDERKVVFFR